MPAMDASSRSAPYLASKLPQSCISLLLLATALALCPVARSQFVTPPKDLKSANGYADITVRYKEVPAGICELDPNVKSYSGYADVAEYQHIFWWFFEARSVDPKTAPLTVWINGGPGSSSMIGLFQENGPCRVDSSGKPYNNTALMESSVQHALHRSAHPSRLVILNPNPRLRRPTKDYIIQLPSTKCPEYASDDACGTYSYPNQTLTASTTPEGAPKLLEDSAGVHGSFPSILKTRLLLHDRELWRPLWSDIQ